jgi:hypothetical protein
MDCIIFLKFAAKVHDSNEKTDHPGKNQGAERCRQGFVLAIFPVFLRKPVLQVVCHTIPGTVAKHL